MVRTPSCDKNGLKKGTWTAEEDRKLTAYVTRYGCWNWRQLPKFAGNYIIKIFSGKAYYFQYFMKMVDSKNIHFGFHNRSPSFVFLFSWVISYRLAFYPSQKATCAPIAGGSNIYFSLVKKGFLLLLPLSESASNSIII
jgi:hypothetical protein